MVVAEITGELEQPAPWYVVRTKPRRELLVVSLLSRTDDFPVFLPEVLQPGNKANQLLPLFPGYLFVQVALASSPAAALRHTPGVIGFVGSEQQPTPVAATVVHALQDRVRQVNAKGGLVTHSFQPGDAVAIKAGPLQGLDAVFVGPLAPTQRVEILLHFLGQQQQLQIEVGLLEKVNPRQETVETRPARRTRGHGRRIQVAVGA